MSGTTSSLKLFGSHEELALRFTPTILKTVSLNYKTILLLNNILCTTFCYITVICSFVYLRVRNLETMLNLYRNKYLYFRNDQFLYLIKQI